MDPMIAHKKDAPADQSAKATASPTAAPKATGSHSTDNPKKDSSKHEVPARQNKAGKEHHASGTAPTLAITIAIIVALILSVAAIWTYRQSSHPAPAVTTKQDSAKATSEDIDTATKAIDQSLQAIGDGKSFSAGNNLSDSNLGL